MFLLAGYLFFLFNRLMTLFTLQAHVMKAACSALTPALRNGLAVCQRFTQGTCSPGSEGDRVCGSARNFELNRSNCKEVGDSYRCAFSMSWTVHRDVMQIAKEFKTL